MLEVNVFGQEMEINHDQVPRGRYLAWKIGRKCEFCDKPLPSEAILQGRGAMIRLCPWPCARLSKAERLKRKPPSTVPGYEPRDMVECAWCSRIFYKAGQRIFCEDRCEITSALYVAFLEREGRNKEIVIFRGVKVCAEKLSHDMLAISTIG